MASTNLWKYTLLFGSGCAAGGYYVRYKTAVDKGHENAERVQQEINKQCELTEKDKETRHDDLNRRWNDFIRHHRTEEPRLTDSIREAERVCKRFKTKYALPGLAVTVSVNGETKWSKGYGYANLEHSVKMKPSTVVRIGSISKAMTMGMLGKFIESGQLDIDLPVQTYVPNFPKKEVDGKEVTITTRHLLSHLSGIRHYSTKAELETLGEGNEVDEMNLKEYFLKENFESVEKSLALFQNDELLYEPGSKYTYSTHGWTLVSAVLEKLAEKPFDKYAKQVFQKWGLQNTFLDEPEPIIFDRAAPYTLDKKTGSVKNSPYVDNSYKWAGGGFLSTVDDIVQFGNIMLASFQNPMLSRRSDKDENTVVTSAFLQSDTVESMWTGETKTAKKGQSDKLYGLGFSLSLPMRNCFFCASRQLMTTGHGGAAIGGSSKFSITFPKDVRFTPGETDNNPSSGKGQEGQVKGVVVAIVTNLTDVNLNEPVEEITKLFEWLI